MTFFCRCKRRPLRRVALAPVAERRADRELDDPGLKVGDEAAHHVRKDMPTLGSLTVVLAQGCLKDVLDVPDIVGVS